MTVYEALIEEGKQRPCEPSNPCCEEPCDEPSFWDLLPQCRLNWIALGLAALAIGFGLIGLGYINIGTAITVSTGIDFAFDTDILTQGTNLIMILLTIILASAWIFFNACSDDWNIVVVGSLLAASGPSLAAIGLLYNVVSQISFVDSAFGPTWFDIARSLILTSIVSFLLLAYLVYANSCRRRIDAKKAVIVSLIFLSGGWAAWSLGRLLTYAVITFRYAELNSPSYVFPSAAFSAFVFVSVINIALVLALGWYVLGCVADNCFTVFLPLFASAASLGNWALYRVGLNVLSYVGEGSGIPTGTPLTPFAIAIGVVSITALILTFNIANCPTNPAVLAASSAIPFLHAIATYTTVATADNLLDMGDFVNSILQGIFSGIAITAALISFLRCKAKCPIPNIIYGLVSGTLGWAVIYLYSTYSSDILELSDTHNTDGTILNIGLGVIAGVAIVIALYTQFIARNELLDAITLASIALLTVGAAGFVGTLAYYRSTLNTSDITAATIIYAVFVLTALLVPLYFARCSDGKRKLVIAIASLAFGIAAVDFGRLLIFARAIAFAGNFLSGDISVDFSPVAYITSVVGVVLVGQAAVWGYCEANLYTAGIASFVGLVAGRIATQGIFFIEKFNNTGIFGIGLIGTPWLVFTFGIVALLAYLEFKSLCIPQQCRFLPGLLIPALGIAVFGGVAGMSAAVGVLSNPEDDNVFPLVAFALNPPTILLNSIPPLVGFFLSLQAFKCTSCLAYFPSCIAHIAVVYVGSQFEIPDVRMMLSPINTTSLVVPPPLLNFTTAVYRYFELENEHQTTISAYATFITQTGFVYLLFLAPALIAGFALSCSKPVSAAVLGAAITATLISFGAVGIAGVVSGVLQGIAGNGVIDFPITPYSITFAEFLTGIRSQLVLLAVGVATVLFIIFDKCRDRAC